MGTRHLIAVQLDGEYKIAQYGQWDGYPDGKGIDVLHFLTDIVTNIKIGVFVMNVFFEFIFVFYSFGAKLL